VNVSEYPFPPTKGVSFFSNEKGSMNVVRDFPKSQFQHLRNCMIKDQGTTYLHLPEKWTSYVCKRVWLFLDHGT